MRDSNNQTKGLRAVLPIDRVPSVPLTQTLCGCCWNGGLLRKHLVCPSSRSACRHHLIALITALRYIVNDSYRTDVMLMQAPHIVALAAMIMTAHKEGINLRPWLATLSVELREVHACRMCSSHSVKTSDCKCVHRCGWLWKCC